MAKFPIVGGSYTIQAQNANAQMSMNLYLENDESGSGKSPNSLLSTPGKRVFLQNTLGPPRGFLSINGRTFVVQGGSATNFLELTLNNSGQGIGVGLGQVGDDGLPVSMCSNGDVLLIASAGVVYLYDMTGPGGFSQVTALSGIPISFVGFLDSYFLALRKNSRIFQTSGIEDGTVWDPLDVNEISVFGDNVPTMFVDHRLIWFLGLTKTVVYYDSGDASTPFLPVPGGFIEQGIKAMNSTAKLDNSIFWLGGDERGAGIIWRANGYTPIRVSTFAVEYAIQGYDRIDDAVSYSYQDQGHSFYVLYFPTAKAGPNGDTATWVFDQATNQWHQRGFWDTNFGKFEADRAWNHVYAQFRQPNGTIINKHLVGDWFAGNIFETSILFYDDAGTAIRRVRRANYIGDEQKWQFHSELQVDVEVGLGNDTPAPWDNSIPYAIASLVSYNDAYYVALTAVIAGVQPDTHPSSWAPTTAGIDPQMCLRWSDNGAQTWSNEHWVSCGKGGEYLVRAIWRRLGRTRSRVYEISMTDPIPWRICAGYIQVQPGVGS